MNSDYFQPEFYHFDEDSIFLAKFIFENVRKEYFKENSRFLEVGSGCGVISFELSQLVEENDSLQFDLIEKQIEFEEFSKKNRVEFGGKNSQFNFHWEDFLKMEFFLNYPCVYSNPPFFYLEDSRPSHNSQRDICRRIPKKMMDMWLFKMVEVLEPRGNLFFCHRDSNLSANSFSMEEIKKEKRNKSIFYWWKKTT